MEKLVSIVIPSYNHASALPACLDSIFEQTYGALEVIVVDDGSTDDTREVMREFRDEVTLIYQQNSGANPARNRGFKEAKGEFVIFCDADVVMQPDMLEKMVKALDEHPDASYAYSAFRFGWKKFAGIPWSDEKMRQTNFVHTTSLIRAKDFPGFDESIRRFQDWDVWLTMLAQGKRGVLVDEELFRVDIHGPTRIGSQWLPKIAYGIPWIAFGFMPKRVRKYLDARAVIAKKHKL